MIFTVNAINNLNVSLDQVGESVGTKSLSASSNPFVTNRALECTPILKKQDFVHYTELQCEHCFLSSFAIQLIWHYENHCYGLLK